MLKEREKMQSKFFKSKKIFDNVTLIAGLAGEQCYLIEGTEKALLIDTLTGIGSLKAFVRELTNLPVTVVNTHGHLDHCGSNPEYGECYIHPDDIVFLYENLDPELRYSFATGRLPRDGFLPNRDDVIPSGALKTYPIYDGDIFDLGGVKLEVIEVKGHTHGTIVLLDREKRVLYSGDACNSNTLLFLPCSVTIEEYRESLLHLKSFQSAFDEIYGGHDWDARPNVLIDEALELCDRIMAGTDDKVQGESLGRPCVYAAKMKDFRREDGKLANIAYAPNHIFKNQSK